LFIENKLLYLLPLQDAQTLSEWTIHLDGQELSPDETLRPAEGLPHYPVVNLRLRGAPPAQLTLAAYGYMAELARQAAYRLAYEYELFCELVIPSQLSPFEQSAIHESLRRTGRLLTIEEGGLSLGWGAEVLARAVEAGGHLLKGASRLAAADLPVPASPALEQRVLPGVDHIMVRCLEMAQKL
jgi:pyruvate/2-oxoglutarate/acetoin dehydrogenase E1 component